MSDILADLSDLHKQATTERSHYYVAKCCQRAIEEITALRLVLSLCKEDIENCDDLSALAKIRTALRVQG